MDPPWIQQFVNAEWSVLIEILLGNNELICIHKISNMKKKVLVEDRILYFLSLYISKLIEGDAPSKIKRRLSPNVFLTTSSS